MVVDIILVFNTELWVKRLHAVSINRSFLCCIQSFWLSRHGPFLASVDPLGERHLGPSFCPHRWAKLAGHWLFCSLRRSGFGLQSVPDVRLSTAVLRICGRGQQWRRAVRRRAMDAPGKIWSNVVVSDFDGFGW